MSGRTRITPRLMTEPEVSELARGIVKKTIFCTNKPSVIKICFALCINQIANVYAVKSIGGLWAPWSSRVNDIINEETMEPYPQFSEINVINSANLEALREEIAHREDFDKRQRLQHMKELRRLT